MTLPGLIDAHLHIMDPDHLDYPWLAEVPAIDKRHLPSDVDTRLAPRFVHVQAGTVAEQGLAEARWIEQLADDHPQIAATVAFAALEKGDAVRDDLAALTELPRVRGIRRLLQDEEPAFFSGPGLSAGLGAVQRAGLTFDACIRWWQLSALVELVSGRPELPVVLDHMGKPPVTEAIGSENGRSWLDGITQLAALPNTHLKVSGLPCEASDATAEPSSLIPWIRAAVDAFGVERTMLGSDWPVSRDQPLGFTYDGWFEFALGALDLSESEAAWMQFGTARAFYGIDLT